MILSLKPDVQKFIEERVTSGKYSTPEDVVAAAIMALDQQEQFSDFQTGELGNLLAEGERSIEQEGTLDGDEAFRLRCQQRTSARRSNVPARSKKPNLQRAYVPVTALAKTVEFDDVMMRVSFTDGRILSVPLVWFPVLRDATPDQRARYEIGGGGISLHWPELDEDLSVAGLMGGVDWHSA
jgi:Arc/MetJ-type ribon-helix-helix transcriptional regulator